MYMSLMLILRCVAQSWSKISKTEERREGEGSQKEGKMEGEERKRQGKEEEDGGRWREEGGGNC